MKDETLIVVAVLAVAGLYLYNKSKTAAAVVVPVTAPQSVLGQIGSAIGANAGDLATGVEDLFNGDGGN